MAFQGSLAELHLPDIIQLVSVSGKTGVFHLTDGVHRGEIYLQDGRIVHADKPPRPALTNIRHAVGKLETDLISKTLSDTNWNKSQAARILGLSRLGLQKKIDRYGLDRRS